MPPTSLFYWELREMEPMLPPSISASTLCWGVFHMKHLLHLNKRLPLVLNWRTEQKLALEDLLLTYWTEYSVWFPHRLPFFFSFYFSSHLTWSNHHLELWLESPSTMELLWPCPPHRFFKAGLWIPRRHLHLLLHFWGVTYWVVVCPGFDKLIRHLYLSVCLVIKQTN